MSEWETYPPLPTRGGEANKAITDAAGDVIATRNAMAVREQASAAFRERQRQRRLATRGAHAMVEPNDPQAPTAPPIPVDPEADPYQAAGWL